MALKRRPAGQAANVAAAAVAHDCPPPLVPLASSTHAEVFAAVLGEVSADLRPRPAVRALAAAAAGHVLTLDAIQRGLEAQGAIVDGKPSPLLNAAATVTAALISSLRALRVLPATDRRTLAAAAQRERDMRGGRDLEPEAQDGAPAVDWIARLAAVREGREQ